MCARVIMTMPRRCDQGVSSLFFFFFFALADLLSRYTELQPVGMGAFGLVW